MKLISFFVCFFISLSTISYQDVEKQIIEFESRCVVVNEDQASNLSKDCQALLNSLYEDKSQILKKIPKYKNKLGFYKKKWKKCKNQYSFVFLETKDVLKKQQEGILLSNKDLSLYKKKVHDAYKRYKSTKMQYERLVASNKKYEGWITRLENCQNVLYNRFKELRGMNDKGCQGESGLISGDVNLPVYGSADAIENNDVSCLVDGTYAIDSYSDFWLNPISNGTISAGCWAYPDGGLHLGLDIASPMYSEVKAVGNGIVLYANNPVDSNNGYLGNWCGWPNGGGNTICMVVAINNSLYAVSYFHLSNEIMVMAGQQVMQSQTIAKSGNSGNSTGPHTHIEVFALKQDLKSIVNYFKESHADFSFGCGWDKPASCSAYACRVDPQSVMEDV